VYSQSDTRLRHSSNMKCKHGLDFGLCRNWLQDTFHQHKQCNLLVVVVAVVAVVLRTCTSIVCFLTLPPHAALCPAHAVQKAASLRS